MIIEFIGTPGAGKTTLLPTVAEYLQEQGIHARTVVDAARPYAQRSWMGKLIVHLAPRRWRRPLLWQLFYHLGSCHRILFSLIHPRLIYTVLTSQLRPSIPIEARHHALHWFFHLIGYYQFLRSYELPNEALILDEGFVHRVVQMNAPAMEAPDPRRIAEYLALIPRPDLVVAVHAPWELCVERIYQRGIWDRFRTKSNAEVANYVHNANRVVNITVEQMRNSGWAMIEVENRTNDMASPTEELRRKLAGLSVIPRSNRVDSATSIRGWI